MFFHKLSVMGMTSGSCDLKVTTWSGESVWYGWFNVITNYDIIGPGGILNPP